MLIRLRDKLFSIFFCLFLFWYPISNIILGNQGEAVDSIAMRIILIAFFLISLFFYIIYRHKRRELTVLGILVIFGFLFYITQFFYEPQDFKYEGEFLRWGAECTAACLMGITLMKLRSYSTVHRFLPIVVIVVSIFLVSATLKSALASSIVQLNSGMNYQTMAYFLAFLFALSVYYAFINRKSSKLIIRIVIMTCIPVQAVTCCMAGGRGGVVLLVVYILVLSYIMVKLRRISKSLYIILAILSIGVFIFTANYLNLWESAGFNRSSSLIRDKDRFELWKSIWKYVEQNDYIGYGLGGDYYSFGFYTHNIFLDFILELGFLGFTIMIIIFFKMYRTIFKNIMINEIFIVVAIICLFGIVMNMFSGYWISTYTHWMALGIALTYSDYFLIYSKNSRKAKSKYNSIVYFKTHA